MSSKSNAPQVEWVSAAGDATKRQLLVRLPFLVWPNSAKSIDERRDLAHRDYGMITMFVRRMVSSTYHVAVPTIDRVLSQLVVHCEDDHARTCGFITPDERISESDIDAVTHYLKQECIGNLPARWLTIQGAQAELFEDDCSACPTNFGKPKKTTLSDARRQRSNGVRRIQSAVLFTPARDLPREPLIVHVEI